MLAPRTCPWTLSAREAQFCRYPWPILPLLRTLVHPPLVLSRYEPLVCAIKMVSVPCFAMSRRGLVTATSLDKASAQSLRSVGRVRLRVRVPDGLVSAAGHGSQVTLCASFALHELPLHPSSSNRICPFQITSSVCSSHRTVVSPARRFRRGSASSKTGGERDRGRGGTMGITSGELCIGGYRGSCLAGRRATHPPVPKPDGSYGAPLPDSPKQGAESEKPRQRHAHTVW